MKKIIALLLAILLVFLVGCSKDAAESTSSTPSDINISSGSNFDKAAYLEEYLPTAYETFDNSKYNLMMFNIYLEGYDYPVFFDEPMPEIPIDISHVVAVECCEATGLDPQADWSRRYERILTFQYSPADKEDLRRILEGIMALNGVLKVETPGLVYAE